MAKSNFRVALIQNESELLRYSNADIRSQFSENDVSISSFTSSNISEISQRLGNIDAIFIATNALSDSAIRTALTEQADAIHEFVRDSRKGMFFGFQMWMAENPDWVVPFLPESLSFSITKKIIRRLEDGKISLLSSNDGEKLLSNPNKIAEDHLNTHCMNNSNTVGVYWGYISGFGESYKPIAQDNFKSSRKLAIVSCSPKYCRLVVTTIVVDWQKHTHFFDNIKKFIVRGKSYIAVVKRYQRNNIDVSSIISSLRSRQIPFDEWTYDEETFSEQLLVGGYSTIILDPRFGERQKDALVSQIMNGSFDRIFYFDKAGAAKSVNAVTKLAGTGDFSRILEGGKLFLLAEYGDGFWSDSFWTTVDVIDCLSEMGVCVDRFSKSILDSIAPHITDSGSYDGVFGATCGLVRLLSQLGLDDHKYYGGARDWLLERFPDADLFNRCTALDVFQSVGVKYAEELGESTYVEIDHIENCENRVMAIRVCSLLVSQSNYAVAAERFKSLLRPFNHQASSIHEKAEELYLASRILNGMDEGDVDIVAHCYELASEVVEARLPPYGDWGSQSTTARCLLALKEYSQTTLLPVRGLVEEILGAYSEGLETENIDYLIARSSNVREQSKELNAQYQKLASNVRHERIVFTIFYPLFLIIFIALILDESTGGGRLVPYVKEWQDVAAPAIYAFLALFLLFYLIRLRKWGFFPKFLDEILQRLGI